MPQETSHRGDPARWLDTDTGERVELRAEAPAERLVRHREHDISGAAFEWKIDPVRFGADDAEVADITRVAVVATDENAPAVHVDADPVAIGKTQAAVSARRSLTIRIRAYAIPHPAPPNTFVFCAPAAFPRWRFKLIMPPGSAWRAVHLPVAADDELRQRRRREDRVVRHARREQPLVELRRVGRRHRRRRERERGASIDVQVVEDRRRGRRVNARRDPEAHLAFAARRQETRNAKRGDGVVAEDDVRARSGQTESGREGPSRRTTPAPTPS